MAKLWVDDERPAPEGWLWAKSTGEAVRILIAEDVDEMSLDYCLQGIDSGDIVLYWLNAHRDRWPAVVTAHSSSASGCALLERMITKFKPT